MWPVVPVSLKKGKPSTEESGRNSSTEPVKLSLDKLLVQHKYKFRDVINKTVCSSHFPLFRGFHSSRSTRMWEPPPVSQLFWSRGGVVNEKKYFQIFFGILGTYNIKVSISFHVHERYTNPQIGCKKCRKKCLTCFLFLYKLIN